VKVRLGASERRALGARATIVLSFSLVLLFSIFTAPAGAVTRTQVLGRAMSWIRHGVPYSQHRYYQGYRRDCSGFVSMAWGLRESYTTRTISSVAVRVPLSSLKRGDAILVTGRHVSLFEKWVDKRRGLYVALEQTTSGDHARRHVRRVPRHAVGIRRRDITDSETIRRVSAVSGRATTPHPVLVTAVTSSASIVVVFPSGEQTSEPASTTVATASETSTTVTPAASTFADRGPGAPALATVAGIPI
jgi:hypothetical protein